MSALREKTIAIIGSGERAADYQGALADFPELKQQTHAQVPNGHAADLAVICTPPAGHVEEALPLLRAGVDLLIEGTLASTRADAEKITSMAESLGRLVMTAERFRVFEAAREAKRLLDADRIGRLVHIEAARAYKLDAARASALAGGGVWMAYGPDCLDLVDLLAGPVERIRMWGAEHQQEARVEDEVRVEADHGGGLISRISLGWNQQVSAPIARCVGERGEILIGWAQAVLLTERGREVIAPGFDHRTVCRALLDRFLRRVRRSAPAEDRGIQTLGWIEAAYRSLDTERWEIP